MFLDGVISLLRQCSRLEKDPGQLSIASGEIITGPGIGPVRLLQAGITLSLDRFQSHPARKSPKPVHALRSMVGPGAVLHDHAAGAIARRSCA